MTYKRKKRGAGKHVQLSEAFMRTEAWRSLGPVPRALYLELKRRYNGFNNGKVMLSHREAAELLNMHRNSMAAAFAALEERLLIRAVCKGHMGAEGRGVATRWALLEHPLDGRPPNLAYREWGKKPKPVT